MGSISPPVGAVYAEVGTIDVLGAADTGVVGDFQCVISHKQIIVSGGGVVDDLWSFRGLPAVSHFPGGNQ